MKIVDYLVQNGEEHDDTLHKKLFSVNVRLLKTSRIYFSTIKNIVKSMEYLLNKEFLDYGKPHGISGANVGVPLNIITIKTKDSNLTMLNPELIDCSKETRIVSSNCGSLNLKESVQVKRYKEVKVRYYPFISKLTWREHVKKNVIPREESFSLGTIQHEIDHNNGVLIIDKVVEEVG